MEFLLISLILLFISVWALMVLNSQNEGKLSILNQYWELVSYGIGLLLIFIGLIYLLIFVGLFIGSFSIIFPHVIGVAILYIPIAAAFLVWIRKIGINIAEPSGKFLNIVTYIAVSWILLQHIELIVRPSVPYTALGIISLTISLLVFFASASLLRYRKLMKRHMLLPLNLNPLLNGVFVTFAFISLAGVSASLGLFLTHVLSCLIGALVITYFVVDFIREVKIYLK
jgi:hypothetical protein